MILQYAHSLLKGQSHFNRITKRFNSINADVKNKTLYYSNKDMGLFLPLKGLHFARYNDHAIREGEIIVKIDNKADENTKASKIFKSIYYDKQFVIYDGTWYNLKQTFRSIIKRIEFAEDTIYARQDLPDAFYNHRRLTHLENTTYNRILIAYNFKGECISLEHPYRNTLISNAIKDTKDDHLANQPDHNSWKINELKGVVMGLNHFSLMRILGNKFQHGHFDYKDIKLTPYLNVFIPDDKSNYIQFFDDAVDSLNLLHNLKTPTVLDVGSGSGILSIILAKKLLNIYDSKDIKVFCTDITQNAITCTNFNFKANITEWNDIFNSELTSVYPTKEMKFSLIVSFPPYIPVNKIITEDEYGYCDRHGKFLMRLLGEANRYLEEQGKMLLLYPNISEILQINEFNKIEKLCDENNLKIETIIDANNIQTSKLSIYTKYLKRFDETSQFKLYVISKN